uniref:Prolyl endopeptidase-like n=1 Tax=Lactuca sativa TaxID=4236 RepID=A0A9R1XJ28_LACSA|nr:hypothetical protein LSAT_V11C300150790 [Lactuca sativa]
MFFFGNLEVEFRLYYRRVEEGKQYPVLCRRFASLNEEFISHKSPTGGFDFISGKRIEQKLIDYNQEAERFWGYAYEEVSEVSPHRRFIAYTMYDKDNDFFKLCVRDLNSGSLCSKPQADWVCNVAWAKGGQALLYVVTDQKKKPYRIYCSMLGSKDEDVILLEEPEENVHVNIKHTKDFKFVTLYVFSTTYSKLVHITLSSIIKAIFIFFTNAKKEGQSVNYHYILRSPLHSSSPRKWEDVFHLKELGLHFLPLPESVSQISHGPNYDFYSPIMRFTISSFVMPDAVVDYNLSNGKFEIIQQQNLLQERTCVLYVTTSVGPTIDNKSNSNNYGESKSWNDLSEFYGCENHQVVSSDGVKVGLTIVYSHKRKKEGENPGLLHGHGACGELLLKKWCNESKSLLDRGWILAYADVRGGFCCIFMGGGGRGKKWHEDGRSIKKQNSINDYISCAKFLINNKIIHQNKLAGWSYDLDI